jgi:hypothetical protein
MSDEEKAFKAVELKIGELKIPPGSHLAMIAPEDWAPRDIGRFSHYANAVFEERNYGFQLIIFPFGSELAVVTPDGGFT